jgi:hypothetical protein
MKALFLTKRVAYGLDVSGEVNDKPGNLRDTEDAPEYNHTQGHDMVTPHDIEAEEDFPGLGPSKYFLPPRTK